MFKKYINMILFIGILGFFCVEHTGAMENNPWDDKDFWRNYEKSYGYKLYPVLQNDQQNDQINYHENTFNEINISDDINDEWEMVNSDNIIIGIEKPKDKIGIKLKAVGKTAGKIFIGLGLGILDNVKRHIEQNINQGTEVISTLYGVGDGVSNAYKKELINERQNKRSTF